MDLAIILGMIADGMPDRVLIGDRDGGLTGARLRAGASAGARYVTAAGVRRLLYLAENGPAFPARIVAELRSRGTEGPRCLRSLSYGGAKVAPEVIADALRLFPETGFVNAYGLTETASSVAVLGPEDHRDAAASFDTAVRARLGPDAEWGHRIAAFVIVRPGAEAGAGELREWVRQRLRSAKTPEHVVFVQEFPATPTGKVLRRELVALVRPGQPVNA